MKIYGALLAIAVLAPLPAHADLVAKKVKVDLSHFNAGDALWTGATVETVTLMGQPMVAPKPRDTATEKVEVSAVHDGKWIAFRLRWKDPTYDEAGKLGDFSDGAALEFPVKDGVPPPVFMGGKDNPVHLFHWRAQYQRDAEKGMKTVKDIYPNASTDIYPLEFKDQGNLKGLTVEMREQYSHGKAAGNPQSYPKTGVDEILAEGFGTSSVIPAAGAYGKGEWKDGAWTLVIGRELGRKDFSQLAPGKTGNIAFAIWQGQAKEVGSRKSVAMAWTPLKVEE